MVCTLPAPSFGQRGTMWTWTWGMVCPVASPLLTPMVVPAAPSAARTGPASRTTARKRASASAGFRSSTHAACARGTTSTWPSASGCTSRKAVTSGSRATTAAGMPPAAMRQKMQLMTRPPYDRDSSGGAAATRGQASAASSARVAAAGSGAARMARMTAAPAAPAARTAGTRAAVTPPIASTGMAAARTASARRASPCAPPFDGVTYTGPKKARAAAAGASPGGWVETPISASAPTRRRATSAGIESPPRWTPSAPTPSATSRRSLTKSSAPVCAVAARSRSASAKSGPPGRSLSRSCTAGRPASSAAATTATRSRPAVACRSVTRTRPGMRARTGVRGRGRSARARLARERAAHRGRELLRRDGLLEALDHALLPGAEHLRHQRVAGHDDDGHVGALLAQHAVDVHPAGPRHHQVGHDQIDLVAMLRPDPERLFPALRRQHAVAAVLQHRAAVLARSRVVVDQHEDAPGPDGGGSPARAPGARELGDRRHQGGRLEGLDDVVVEAGRQRALPVLQVGVGREGHRRDLSPLSRREGPQLGQQRVAVLAWHRDVGEEDVRLPAREDDEGVGGRGARAHLGAGARQQYAQDLTRVGLVVHDQHARAVERRGGRG